MTSRELINAGYGYQDSRKSRAEAEKIADEWRAKGFLVQLLWVAPTGKWEVWVK